MQDGADPATSVVDSWGRCHDVPNLFVFDGSIWPTSSGMNPTATTAAMSLFLSRRTVEAHVSRILGKLEARSRVEIIRAAAAAHAPTK